MPVDALRCYCGEWVACYHAECLALAATCDVCEHRGSDVREFQLTGAWLCAGCHAKNAASGAAAADGLTGGSS